MNINLKLVFIIAHSNIYIEEKKATKQSPVALTSKCLLPFFIYKA